MLSSQFYPIHQVEAPVRTGLCLPFPVTHTREGVSGVHQGEVREGLQKVANVPILHRVALLRKQPNVVREPAEPPNQRLRLGDAARARGRCQVVEATRSRSKASRGVRNPRVALGRSFISSAIALRYG